MITLAGHFGTPKNVLRHPYFLVGLGFPAACLQDESNASFIRMQRLEPSDIHCLSAAIGWLELGNTTEAGAELALVDPQHKEHPDVLEVRWLLCAQERRWEEALEIAGALVQSAPERSSGWLHQAYAMRRVPEGNVKKAWEALLPAFDKFPKEPTICYNLSCYACQMQQ